MDRRRAQGLFDRAVLLFNRRDYHEAHEDWEHLWHEAEGDERRWLQGLIQIAAAFFHVDRGFYDTGFAKLMSEGHGKAAPYLGDTWGLDLARFLEELEPWVEHGRRVAAGGCMAEGAPARRPELCYVEGVLPSPLPPGETIDEEDA